MKTVGTAEAINSSEAYKTLLKANGHTLIADEPVAIGGTNEGPAPGDYICIALASCKAITLRMYLQRKNWDAGEINVNVVLNKADSEAGPVHTFSCIISATGNLTEEQRQRLVQIAKACPISKLLAKSADVVTVIQ